MNLNPVSVHSMLEVLGLRVYALLGFLAVHSGHYSHHFNGVPNKNCLTYWVWCVWGWGLGFRVLGFRNWALGFPNLRVFLS